MSTFSYNYNEIYAMEIESGRYIAEKYDDAYETLFYETTRKMVAEAVIGKDREILKILDLGCGTGNLTKFLSDKQNCSIVAVDISIDMLHVAKKKLENVKFLSAAIEQLPFKDNSFDVIIGYSVLHHLPDLMKSFDEVFRVLKPNGYAIFGEPVESFLDKHKTLFRALKFPLYLLYLIVKEKNSKNLETFRDVVFDAFSTPVHRRLSEKEIGCCASNRMSFEIKRVGILSPWLGAKLFKSKQIDRLIFKLVWYIDLFLSRIFPQCTSEVLIKGTVRKGILSI